MSLADAPLADAPLSGQVFESHPDARKPAEQICQDRRYHRVIFTRELDSEGYTVHSPCVDCGKAGNDLPMHDAAKSPGPAPVHSVIPEGNLGHNPDADFAEIMRVREMGTAAFLQQAKAARDGKDAPKIEEKAIPMDRATVVALGKHYGLTFVDPEGQSGNAAHVSEKLKVQQDQIEVLQKRAKDAEAAAKNANEELAALRAQAAAESAPAAEAAPAAPVSTEAQ